MAVFNPINLDQASNTLRTTSIAAEDTEDWRMQVSWSESRFGAPYSWLQQRCTRRNNYDVCKEHQGHQRFLRQKRKVAEMFQRNLVLLVQKSSG